MATSSSEKQFCVTCGKAAGMFTCRGCQKDFCSHHVAEHRHELVRQFDEITLEHDRCRQTLNEQLAKSELHPWIKPINDWEQQSIEKIHRLANNARQQLQKTITKQLTNLTEKLNKIAVELRKAQEDNAFFENDLQKWMRQLNELKHDLTQSPNIQIPLYDDNTLPLIVSRDTFRNSTDGIEIIENGQVIIKTNHDSHSEVRCTGEYSFDKHRFRFQIETYNQLKWIFIGIMSKTANLKEFSYCSSSSYGWAGGSQVYLNGHYQHEYNNFKDDIEQHDVIELLVDCDKRMIRLKNERTKSIHELHVQTHKCPFPWQIHFSLFYPNDCVRILEN